MNSQATPMDRPFALSDDDVHAKPIYRVGDDPLPYSRNVRGAALDLMILTFAAMRHARWLKEIGTCPTDVAEQIAQHVNEIGEVVAPSVTNEVSSTPAPPTSPHVGPCPPAAGNGKRRTPASRQAPRRNVGRKAQTASFLFNSHSQKSRRSPQESE